MSRWVAVVLATVLAVAACSGSAAAACGPCGDVNGDGTVDIVDALFIAQSTVGLREALDCPGQADVNASGGVDVVDALFVAQLTVDLRQALTCVRPLGITIESPQALTVFASSPTAVSGTVTGDVASVSCNAVAATLTGASFSATVPLREGNTTIACVAIDTAGNAAAASLTVTLDTTPPRVVIGTPSDKAVVMASPIAVTGTINDIVVGTVNAEQCHVTCNGVLAQVSNRTFVVPSLDIVPGPNTITCTGTDRAGNVGSASVAVTLDTTPRPHLNLVSGNNQTGVIGQQLADPLVVSVVDGGGAGVPNAPVIFKVVQNDGTVSDGTQPSARSIAVTSDASGFARAFFTLGSRAGAGNNQVQVMATGFGGETVFCASALAGQPASIVVDSGNGQTGAVGAALARPLVAVVIDQGNNRLRDVPVTFTVLQGGGNVAGQASKTVTTDGDGRAEAILTLGPDPGVANNVVGADFAGDTAGAARFTASGVLPANPADTAVSGVVLDNSDQPLEGATVTVEETNLIATSDEQGQFLIRGVPVGLIRVHVDGSTIQRPGPWPSLQFELVTVAGQTNALGGGRPVYLLPLDIPGVPNQLCIDGSTGGTLTLDSVPGFALTILPGSVTFPDGGKAGCITVTPVHADKVPMVPNFGQQPRFVVTIQPAGARFDPPAPLTIPNSDGLPPGQKTDMYSFDHDLGQFVSIGSGTVSDDGSVVRSDPGVGVVKAGWHCGGNPSQSGSCCACDDKNPCTSDSCVNGACQHQPVGNGTRCDDASGCSLKTCQGGACVTSSQEADGMACDDKKFCTSFTGSSPGPDMCKSGSCQGKEIPEKELSVTPQEFDFTKLSQLLKGAAEEVSKLGPCDIQAPSISGGFKFTLGQMCCEKKEQIVDIKKLGGFASVNFGGLECFIPGLSLTIANAVKVGVFVGVSAGGGFSGGGQDDPCEEMCKWFVEGSLGLTLSGGVKIENKIDPNVIGATLAAKGGGSLNGSDKCDQVKVEGCAGPITIVGEVVFGGFFKKSVEVTIPGTKKCTTLVG